MEKIEWYWDLERNVAVTGDERGPGDRTLGPYATKGEAENWKSTSEARNEAWDDADEEWESRGTEDDPTGDDE
jgi:hypothetical protein